MGRRTSPRAVSTPPSTQSASVRCTLPALSPRRPTTRATPLRCRSLPILWSMSSLRCTNLRTHDTPEVCCSIIQVDGTVDDRNALEYGHLVLELLAPVHGK